MTASKLFRQCEEPQTEHVSNEKVLKKMSIRMTFIIQIIKSVEISRIHYGKGRIGKCNTHKTLREGRIERKH